MTGNEQTTESPAGEPGPAEQQPAADRAPDTEQKAAAEPTAAAEDQKSEKSTAPKSQTTVISQRARRRPKRSPALVADHFTACPRCSFFLAGYRLIEEDFNEAASNATGDWLDLSWNLSVRNLVAKSYGYEMTEAFQVIQGVCPVCRRTFVVETGDEDAAGDRFSIQISPRS